MRPVEPDPPTNPTWERIVYAESQAEYVPLPSLVDRADATSPVVSVWELDPTEFHMLAAQMAAWNPGDPRPRISLKLLTFGKPLQPIQMVLGKFFEPYQRPFEEA
jgi:hypothetical protein